MFPYAQSTAAKLPAPSLLHASLGAITVSARRNASVSTTLLPILPETPTFSCVFPTQRNSRLRLCRPDCGAFGGEASGCSHHAQSTAAKLPAPSLLEHASLGAITVGTEECSGQHHPCFQSCRKRQLFLVFFPQGFSGRFGQVIKPHPHIASGGAGEVFPPDLLVSFGRSGSTPYGSSVCAYVQSISAVSGSIWSPASLRIASHCSTFIWSVIEVPFHCRSHVAYRMRSCVLVS